MKRIFIALVFIAVLAAGLSSCKSHEKCPAYGQVPTEQAEDIA